YYLKTNKIKKYTIKIIKNKNHPQTTLKKNHTKKRKIITGHSQPIINANLRLKDLVIILLIKENSENNNPVINYYLSCKKNRY
ncbi:MAG: hypothetical protein PHQ17_03875, partial [Methanobacterium sp.]|nr:hypothetical protein [Methanobacterium sp.]